MRGYRIGSGLGLLVAGILIGYYLGQPANWAMQNGVQQLFLQPPDDPADELISGG
jgi:hypothetical protein